MGAYQDKVRQLYADRNYTNSLRILGLGLCEEAGEVAAAILDVSVEFKSTPCRKDSSLEHELRDCLTYLCAIANAADIDLGI